MLKRCQKGKSCGASCINKGKVCLIDLKQSLVRGIGMVRDLVRGETDKETQTDQKKENYPVPKAETAEKVKKNALEESFTGDKGKQFYKNLLDDLDELKGEFSKDERQNLAASHFRESREFARRLDDKLPPDVKATMSGGLITMKTETKSGDKVNVYYSPKVGFHFDVNGSIDAGTVKGGERAELQAALTVRNLFRTVVSSLPEGAIMRTAAHMEDGRGQRRIDIYNKLGFQLPDSGGNMFGKVGSGKTLSPSNQNEFVDQARDTSSVFFAEPTEKTVGPGVEGSAEDWYQLVFGKKLSFPKGAK